MRCFIAGAGEYCGFVVPGPDDYVIAADRGYEELISRGIRPDLVVGDFDSLGDAPEHPNVLRSPMEKDDTDMIIAVRQGFAQGCDMFIIDGGLGGRFDHTLANCQILAYISQSGGRGFLLGREMSVTAITNGTLGFLPGAPGRVSVFCAGSIAEGVTITGLKYPLDDALLTYDYPLGVSNEFTGAPAEISVRSGTLLIMWTGGPDMIDNR